MIIQQYYCQEKLDTDNSKDLKSYYHGHQQFEIYNWRKKIQFPFCARHLNPLLPKSDKHLISPYNITPESNINVTRIKEMITKEAPDY